MNRLACSLALLALTCAGVAVAQDEAPSQVLFENVRVFDGTSDKLTGKTKVLVEGNLIKGIGPSAEAGPGATVP